MAACEQAMLEEGVPPTEVNVHVPATVVLQWATPSSSATQLVSKS
jgi:hypothetical protein